MILWNKEQIKHLHSKLIQETGGIDGIRDEGLLNSALSVQKSGNNVKLWDKMTFTKSKRA